MTCRLLCVIAATGMALAVPARSLAAPAGRTLFAASFMPAVTAAAAPSPSATRLRLDLAAVLAPDRSGAGPEQGPPPVAVEYSDAYNLRARIHRIGSFAMLPLFGAEAIVGQSLYNSPTPGKKSAHLAIAGGIAGLFAVNSATGVWNLLEARRDPHGRTRRLVHGILMLAADAGFLATAALGPESEHRRVEGSPATHRAVAFASISTATVGYLIMLIGGR